MQTTLRKAVAFCAVTATLVVAAPSKTDSTDPSRLAALTEFFMQMPKGGDIHHHYSGAMYAETYLDWAKSKGMQLNPQTLLLVPDTAHNAISIDSLRKNGALQRKVLEAWSDMDYRNHYETQAPPDQKFFGTFGYFGNISNAFLDSGLMEIKARAVAENVQYIETMLKSVGYSKSDTAFDNRLDQCRTQKNTVCLDSALRSFFDATLKDTTFLPKVTSFTRLVDSIHRGIDDTSFVMRFQTYVSRTGSASNVFSGLIAAFKADSLDTLVVGVNIVGAENDFVAMRDEWLHVRMFRFLKAKYPKVNIAMHAGELALGMVKPEDLSHHINDAVFVSGAQRIGHGVDLPYERAPKELLAAMAKRKTCVEINLTSNEFILGVSGASHPIELYRKAGVPVVLSTDDPGVSRNNLSSEYVLLASRYGLTYKEIKTIVFNSIEYSFLSKDMKTRQTKLLAARFKAFEEKYGKQLP